MIYIDKNGKRVRPEGVITYGGSTFNGNALMFPEVVSALGITSIDEPSPPADYSPSLYDRIETDDAPYVEYIRKTDEQVFNELSMQYELALDQHLDNVAREHLYNNRFTFALRAGYEGPYREEGIAFASWMDACSALTYAMLIDVKSGQIQPPAVHTFITNLPEFIKP